MYNGRSLACEFFQDACGKYKKHKRMHKQLRYKYQEQQIAIIFVLQIDFFTDIIEEIYRIEYFDKSYPVYRFIKKQKKYKKRNYRYKS